MSEKIAYLFYRSHTCKFRCTRFVFSTKVSMIYSERDLHKRKSTRRYILISIKGQSLGCKWLLSNNIWLCLCYHVDLIRLVYSYSSIKWNSSKCPFSNTECISSAKCSCWCIWFNNIKPQCEIVRGAISNDFDLEWLYVS